MSQNSLHIATPAAHPKWFHPASSRPVALDCWDIVQRAGEGTSSEVFFARPSGGGGSLAADYAVKRLRAIHESDPVMLRMFRLEAVCGGQVTHRHLVPILASHVAEPPYYFVMPRIRGATVRQVLDACGHCSLPQSLWIVRQVAEAIGALHVDGWVHGDVKPGNVLVESSGHATLFDYGFAARFQQGAGRDHLALQATMPYAAPELFTSSRSAGPASDVYSLGVMLFELISGRRPFHSPQPARLAEQHLRVPPPSLRSFVPQVPRSVSQWVTQMLAKEPDRRPASSGELQAGIARLEAESFALRGGDFAA